MQPTHVQRAQVRSQVSASLEATVLSRIYDHVSVLSLERNQGPHTQDPPKIRESGRSPGHCSPR